jgi:hypothetical protein
MAETFDGDWLALREPFDAASRSPALARALSAVLPARPRLIDLGAGTASLFRWLAPHIARAQEWTLADADGDLLARAFAEIRQWAAGRGLPVTVSGGVMAVHTPQGAWRVRAELVDLAGPLPALGLNRHDAVVCSALLDLVSIEWIAALAAGLKRPLLACLSVDGRDALRPVHVLDRAVLAAFRRDLSRAKGLGLALGARAPGELARALRGRGFSVRLARSDWVIGRGEADMLDRLVASLGEVAARRLPDRRDAVRRWVAARAGQVDRHRLAMRIGHRDCLALPPGLIRPGE